ncbi:MAG: CCA tRNA nucleotidyltransferase, partial [Actinomycetia bacterium]|nr:CCA tRNA nucleotidyltransferase [Actinomycetes bacterium]
MTKHEESRLDIPEPITAIGERIAGAGGVVYMVGGWVRDRLRGVDSHDIDLATSLTPDEVRSAVSGLGSIYNLGERFGTVGVRAGGYTVEITTFRRDRYSPGSRHPEVTPVASIEEDLSRRDFTVNAMALSLAPEPGRLLDPFGGARDIKRGLIRTPGPPGPRMAEDPLRMMRAVRFAAQLGYEIDGELLGVLEGDAGLLDSISRERCQGELERILISPGVDTGVRTLVDTGLMEYVSPEVAAMEGVEQPSTYHRADVLEHTLLMMKYLPDDPLLRRAALFHDVGKPPTKVTTPKLMFPEHEKVGEELTRRAMRRLR